MGPLLRHALTNTTGPSEHGLFTGPNVEKRALLQEAATYVGWSRAFRRDWTGASDAHAVGAALALPRDASGCTLPRWRVQDGWLTPERSWTVHPLAVKAPILRFGNVVAPICAVRRRFGAKDRPGAGPGWCARRNRVYLPDLSDWWRSPTLFLGGKDGSALWQRAPHCVFFAGEVTSSGAPPPDWGDAAANSGLTDRDVVLNSEPEDTITIESALLLFDAREGHKMFWHHQTESVSRLALALCRLFDRDGKAASDLPEQTRNMLSRAVILFPQALTATITRFYSGATPPPKLRKTTKTKGLRPVRRAACIRYGRRLCSTGRRRLCGHSRRAGRAAVRRAPRWEPRGRHNDDNWIAELASKAAAPTGDGTRSRCSDYISCRPVS